MGSKQDLALSSKNLRVRGARENNLKDLNLEIPHDSFVAVTGLSGSGKSSLAFDTIYAEGQRRYIETFSPYTRQFFDKVKKPEVESIENVRPAIAIQQRTRITNSRSTVGTISDLNDYLKILWANLSAPVCPNCGIELVSYSAKAVALWLENAVSKSRLKNFSITAPVTASPAQVDRLLAAGFSRYIDRSSGEILELDQKSAKATQGSLLVIIERFTARSFSKTRAQQAVESAYSLAEGQCGIAQRFKIRNHCTVSNHPSQTNSQHRAVLEVLNFANFFTCAESAIKLPQPKAAIFSFNHPLGACPGCKGFGKALVVDPALCVPDHNLSISKGAIQCWSGPAAKGELRKLLAFCKEEKIDTKIPWKELAPKERHHIFNHKSKSYRGVNHWFKRLERKSYKMHVRVFLSRYRTQVDCPQCHGTRFKPESLSYQINGVNIARAMQLPLSDLLTWILGLRSALSPPTLKALRHTFSALTARLTYLCELGLPYLSLDRQARTLSGGETQRVNLAAALGSELVSTHFVLDEPSVGLHMRDTHRLISAMQKLRSNGNSLLVVEHDLDCLASSDHLVELGPEAGSRGGEVIYSGKSAKWRSSFPMPTSEVASQPKKAKKTLLIQDARARNLKNIALDIPLEQLVCLSGVSGSGKSSLVSEVIKRAYEVKTLGLELNSEDAKVSGFEHVEQLLLIDQSPLSKSPRSNIATFTGIWDEARELLAASEEARIRVLTKSSFSFNVDGGRCPSCKGAGFIREDMQFLSDVYLPCDACLGKRFQNSVLEVHYNGLNADQILKLSVDQAKEFFRDNPICYRNANNLSLLGLGHLSLGHSLSELSGGEAQRLKLVPFISEAEKKRSLLIFDEPTTGLHWEDVRRLLELFRLLVKKGHSVLCVEHNPIMLLGADWIIDLGPEGGEQGGHVLMAAHPSQFLKAPKDARFHTANGLKQFCSQAESPKAPELLKSKNAKPAELSIVGAREHNLKNISLNLPYNKIVALTGVSGSGKSTLAKDIIYSEGQRRYLDCLSPYARNFIHELKKPDVDSVSNVRPTVCVSQHTFQPGRLSTVGTMSEAYNFLRLLYAKVGHQYCPDHPTEKIQALTTESMTEIVQALDSDLIKILAPVIKSKKGNHKQVFELALRSEITAVRVDGQFGKPSSFQEGLERNKVHTIEFVVAQFNPKSIDSELIALSIEQALSLGAGTIVVVKERGQEELVLSRERACPTCKRGFFRPDPEDLSFVSKRGACPSCAGSGLNKRGTQCSSCEGQRLVAHARNLRLSIDKSSGLNIYELSRLDSKNMKAFLLALPLGRNEELLAAGIYKELISRLDILISFGLDYLEHNRSCLALSGGELQRLRLATAIGSPLSGVFYIFDEPSAGLHPLDNLRVIDKFKELNRKGSAVMIIEHDPQTITACDYVVDMGPGGGQTGGEIVYAGPMAQFISSSGSETARAIRDEVATNAPATPKRTFTHQLKIERGNKNYLKNFSLALPLNSVLTIAGVSGSGKSSLLHGLIYDTLSTSKDGGKSWRSETAQISSTLDIARVLVVDQQPIGRTSRSTPASYLGIWDEVRKLFASSLDAKSKGYTASFFSYNTGKGRCPECKGLGEIRLEMSFMAEASVLCEACKGARFTDDAQQIKYLNLSISEALSLTFDEARIRFANHRRIHQALHQACQLGLGYLTLGQPSSSLSGGESQRIKLISELCGTRQGHTLYLLDEPTTGLHKADVLRLMTVLKDLVAAGNTVFIIEHDADVLKNSDFVVELGEGPGERGGKVVFKGTPKELANGDTPWGRILSGSDGYGVGLTAGLSWMMS